MPAGRVFRGAPPPAIGCLALGCNRRPPPYLRAMNDESAVPGPSDPYAREAQTFPRLSRDMVARVAAYGREEHIAPGAHLFGRGERSVDFFLLLEGEVEIYNEDEEGRPGS